MREAGSQACGLSSVPPSLPDQDPALSSWLLPPPWRWVSVAQGVELLKNQRGFATRPALEGLLLLPHGPLEAMQRPGERLSILRGQGIGGHCTQVQGAGAACGGRSVLALDHPNLVAAEPGLEGPTVWLGAWYLLSAAVSPGWGQVLVGALPASRFRGWRGLCCGLGQGPGPRP